MNKLKILTDGLNAIQAFDKEQDEFDNSFKKFVDGHFVFTFGSMLVDIYIKTLSDIVGDKSEWIDWYIYENDYGRKRLTAGLKGKRLKVINTPKKLLELIEL